MRFCKVKSYTPTKTGCRREILYLPDSFILLLSPPPLYNRGGRVKKEVQEEDLMRHQLTKEERQRGFRAAVFAVQIKHNLDFNEAVQWLMRKISPGGNWVKVRENKQRT